MVATVVSHKETGASFIQGCNSANMDSTVDLSCDRNLFDFTAPPPLPPKVAIADHHQWPPLLENRLKKFYMKDFALQTISSWRN